MVRAKKKLKTCREDRLSQLPDALLSEILSHLSTRDAVRTSGLSTRWKSLWQCVPALDLNRGSFRTFDAFTRFVYRVLDSDSWIRKLRLHIDDFSHAERFITRWIDDLSHVTTRKIQHLDVKCLYAFKIPLSLYTWEALVHLQLYRASFAVNAEFVCLPSLKILCLENLVDPNKAMLQKLISGSPVLEDLKIISLSTDDGNVLQVCSHTLKRIEIHKLTVMIDAPSLVHLHLHHASLPNVDFVSFPCMKIMHLVLDEVEDALQKFISGSPVLEDLGIISFSETDTAKDLQIFSQTVKRIEIAVSNKVVIDAPLLQFLGIWVSSTNTFEIINLGISAKLEIVAVSEGKGDETFNSVIPNILTNISRFKELVISNDFWKDIFLYTKSGPVLQFCDLSRLDAKFSESDLEMLPTILESCPKLESLILTMIEVLYMSHKKKKKKEEAKVMFSTVPQCLVSSLKFVELKRPKKSPGHEGETELIRYLLKNATMLQTLKLDIYYPEKAKRGFLQELHTMPKCSSSCEIHCSFN